MYNIRVTAQPGRRDDVLELFRQLADASDAEPGTLLYTFSTVDAEPDTIVTFEVFRDAVAVEAHKAGAALRQVMRELGPLVAAVDAKVGTPAFGKGLPSV